MATTEEPLALESGQADIAERPLGVMTRPQGGNGWRDWLSTVDHKKIGIMYGVAAMFFFIVGAMFGLDDAITEGEADLEEDEPPPRHPVGRPHWVTAGDQS